MAPYTTVYPGDVPSFSGINPRVDGTSVVNAIDVNSLYAEMISVATYVGANPHRRAVSAPWGTGSFVTSSLEFGNVASRINNVENGTYIVYNDYISRSAASGRREIKPTANVVNLTLSPSTSVSQTARMLEVYDSSSNLKTYIDVSGKFWTAAIDGGSA